MFERVMYKIEILGGLFLFYKGKPPCLFSSMEIKQNPGWIRYQIHVL
jgi:hypothetical protein